MGTFSSKEEQILREAAARLSLHRFEEERGLEYSPTLAGDFVRGYLDGAEGAALERAAGHKSLDGERLAAFAYGWCRGSADLQGHRPLYDRVEEWLSRRVSSGGS
jgi:hypothetical protein